eukprot:7378391-Pyramimonas_sp.AAC.1
MSGPFLAVSSGAASGGLGCELWLDMEEPLATHKDKEVTFSARGRCLPSLRPEKADCSSPFASLRSEGGGYSCPSCCP